VAIGFLITTFGDQSVALCRGASTAAQAVAIGYNANANNTGAIAIGEGATANGNYNIAIGKGAGTWVSGAQATMIGINTSASRNGTAIGYQANNSNASAPQQSIALGTNSRTESTCEVGFGLSGFTTNADKRIGFIGCHMTTTDATVTEIGTNTAGSDFATSPTGRIVLTNDSSYIFDCDIVARNTATDTETAAYNLKFCIRRGAAAANTALVGTPVVTVIGEDTGTTGWDVGVTADTTNGRPNISVTGEAAKTIRWVANIRMTKVTG
jgi:hypothetical protein